MRAWIGLVVGSFLAGIVPCSAQQSTNYQLEEHVFNGDGLPGEDGTLATSASFRMTST